MKHLLLLMIVIGAEGQTNGTALFYGTGTNKVTWTKSINLTDYPGTIQIGTNFYTVKDLTNSFAENRPMTDDEIKTWLEENWYKLQVKTMRDVNPDEPMDYYRALGKLLKFASDGIKNAEYADKIVWHFPNSKSNEALISRMFYTKKWDEISNKMIELLNK